MVSVYKLHRGGTEGTPKLEKPQDAKAVVDGNVITSQGPGTSFHGTLKKVEKRKLFFFFGQKSLQRERERRLCDTVLPCFTQLSACHLVKSITQKLEFHRILSQLARHQSGTEVAVCLEDRGRTLR